MAKSTPKHENTPRQKTRQTREKTAATENDRLIPGFHAVRETLRLGRRVLAEIWISEGKRSGRTQEIIQMAEIQRIPLCFKKDSELSGIFPHIAHQGIVGVAKAFAYADFQDIMRLFLQERPTSASCWRRTTSPTRETSARSFERPLSSEPTASSSRKTGRPRSRPPF